MHFNLDHSGVISSPTTNSASRSTLRRPTRPSTRSFTTPLLRPSSPFLGLSQEDPVIEVRTIGHPLGNGVSESNLFTPGIRVWVGPEVGPPFGTLRRRGRGGLRVD